MLLQIEAGDGGRGREKPFKGGKHFGSLFTTQQQQQARQCWTRKAAGGHNFSVQISSVPASFTIYTCGQKTGEMMVLQEGGLNLMCLGKLIQCHGGGGVVWVVHIMGQGQPADHHVIFHGFSDRAFGAPSVHKFKLLVLG
uniref:Uncharacterized protein n=1 Tax=Anopheles coluzzii TaxID=1518534 RepID=A0A8W7PUI0_ANOCL